jgi:hypothetical protein
MKKTRCEPSQEKMGLWKSGLDRLGRFNHIETLMMPMEIQEDHRGSLFFKIGEDGKSPILDPLHSHMDNLGGDALALDQVCQPKEFHRQEVNPEKTMKGAVVI